ncbi:zf-HC2 domain-containing protein [Aeribacillus pallidus]|uniref:zf-HC2 domain-containing protein n=1 Tax=Aeribacillus pallidus TaxID=33936 RepID=UPI003D1AB6CC
MKPCPPKIVEYMHEYLDEELSADKEKFLRDHLQTCKECQHHFHELKKTIALVQSTSHIKAPDNFTESVMQKLPKEKKKVGINRWFRNHPFLTAASLFFVLMMGSLTTTWNEDQQFSFTKQPNLVVENHTVIVPEGEVVEGDIVVRNGDIRIEGEVKGNVTVINGNQYLASAGNVTGEIEEINQAFDWLWHKLKEGFKEAMQLFEREPVLEEE